MYTNEYVGCDYQDHTFYPNAFDSHPVNNCGTTPITAGIQHNEVYGRNSHCNFGQQERGIVSLCSCLDVRDQHPGWAHPDCPKMLSQHDSEYILATIQRNIMMVGCTACGKLIPNYERTRVDDDIQLCIDCFYSEYLVCERCGEILALEFRSDEYSEFCEDCALAIVGECDDCGRVVFDDEDGYWSDDDHLYCEECADENTFVCSWCNETYHDSEANNDSNITLCNSCSDDAFTCDACGRFVHQDSVHEYNDDYYCPDCYRERKTSHHMHGYGFMPYLKFFNVTDEDTDGVAYYGIELEIDDGDYQDLCTNELNRQFGDVIWMTVDSSLSDDGIELKSMPCSYRYHMEVLRWKDVLKTCLKYGYKSHYAGYRDDPSCGLHIHIGRAAFGDQHSIQDGNIAKFLYIIEKFWDQMVILSRRTNDSINSWAMRYCLENTASTHDIIDETREKNGNDRHYCVNLSDIGTVEVRIFRGTLSFNTLMASLQLCDMIRHISMNVYLEDIHEMSWSDFKGYASPYPELQAYIAKRGL